MFAPVYIICVAVVVQLTNPTLYKNFSWSFFPNSTIFTHTFIIGTYIIDVLLTFILARIAKSPLTMGLHGREIITNIMRDEKARKAALGSSGAHIEQYTCHGQGSDWTFGLASHSSGVIVFPLPPLAVQLTHYSSPQFFYLALMMGIFAAIMALLAARGVWALPDTR
ncbi:hypothetical protein FIBSPDRAFT_1052340 [Athelia psychrophila]|uniref:Uncharacterized protein n=1 Tax=Athelia psychrophila TaxID=1759441 RepID=A0A165XG56_9AGAM|nr:hypothetical protein FIBSPDRAFT_1052340 [Fibularhizoctonia sp. CBS 109695]